MLRTAPARRRPRRSVRHGATRKTVIRWSSSTPAASGVLAIPISASHSGSPRKRRRVAPGSLTPAGVPICDVRDVAQVLAACLEHRRGPRPPLSGRNTRSVHGDREHDDRGGRQGAVERGDPGLGREGDAARRSGVEPARWQGRSTRRRCCVVGPTKSRAGQPTSPTSASRCAKPLRRSGVRCRGCRRSAPLMTEQTPGPRPIETDGQRSYAWRAVMSLPLGITVGWVAIPTPLCVKGRISRVFGWACGGGPRSGSRVPSPDSAM